MMHSTMKNKRALQTLLAVCFWLAVWQIAAMAMQQEFLLASPLRVLQRLAALGGTAEFWLAVAVSIGRILMGFALAVVGGIIIAAATARWHLASVLMQPLLSTVKAVPVASFILLALLWMNTGAVPVFCSFVMVLPMVWSNVEQGIRQTDRALLEMARCYGFSRWKLLRLVYGPSVLPYFQAALSSGIGMAWKSGVAAEVLCVPAAGLGRDLYYAKIYFETPDLFAVTVTVVVLSLCMERLMMWCTRRWALEEEQAHEDR